MELVQPAFLLVQLVAALIALNHRDLMVAVIMFAAFSFCSALLFTLMDAVDVGFTEAIVGAATTLFYIAVLYRVKRRSSA
ncbi:MAG: DUF4040 domain-containing protein [Candidatus Desulforudis sp.]|nr:DUF4040 domain-containing protein [Desulforudis sp.]